MDAFTLQSVQMMIHEMQSPTIHAGIYLNSDLKKLRDAFWKQFLIIQAGGGLVENENKEVLFMYRRGRWDLPKGKLDAGENIEECAVREVKEETGLNDLEVKGFLLTTYHTYHEHGDYILKESHWFEMSSNSNNMLVPQTEEDIQELKWVKNEDLHLVLNNTYPSVKEVLHFKVR